MTGPAPVRRSNTLPAEYPQFLAEIKARIAGARTRAALPEPDSELVRDVIKDPELPKLASELSNIVEAANAVYEDEPTEM
jgi:hypothetical protein